MHKPVGVSILTNKNRRSYLERCLKSFLSNCHYRPLCIGIMDNGSTDDTAQFLSSLPKAYGVHFRVDSSPHDLGCAFGSNKAHALVEDCEYAIHIESDFVHMTEEESGVDKHWLHRTLEFMDGDGCDYLYLRRMQDERDVLQHWWSQWMPKLEGEGEFMRCPGFWWSNNPALRNVKALLESGTLPLDESKDGGKGSANWSRPEMEAPKPPNACVHRWGVFAHENFAIKAETGCDRFERRGLSTCKYGFYVSPPGSLWCRFCDHRRGIADMPEHERRYRGAMEGGLVASVVSVYVDEEPLDKYLAPSLDGLEVERWLIRGGPNTNMACKYNDAMSGAMSGNIAFCHPDVEFSKEAFDNALGLLAESDDVGIVGFVGVDEGGDEIWGDRISAPQDAASLDSCFLMTERRSGMKFDEETFDGLHLYAEDLCYQARDKGLRVVVVPAPGFKHHSATWKKQGPCWGQYPDYKDRLRDKWADKFEVVTT